MSKRRITFGQWEASNLETLEQDFELLVQYLESNPTDILLLPELPFDSWFCSLPKFEKARWDLSVRLHDEWMDKLSNLRAGIICGTRPYSENERHNVGWIYDSASKEFRDIHGKRYLPNEEGFWEANWYNPADISFDPFQAAGITAGFMICTDLWFMDHARDYGQDGVDLILVPRSTPLETVEKWIVGGKAVAIISGAYVISSNHFGVAEDGVTQLGGTGYAMDPDGRELALSSKEQPWITIEIDLDRANQAKKNYPRYVK